MPSNNLVDQLMLNRSGIILCIPATKNDQVLETGHAANCIVPEVPCRIEHADKDCSIFAFKAERRDRRSNRDINDWQPEISKRWESQKGTESGIFIETVPNIKVRDTLKTVLATTCTTANSSAANTSTRANRAISSPLVSILDLTSPNAIADLLETDVKLFDSVSLASLFNGSLVVSCQSPAGGFDSLQFCTNVCALIKGTKSCYV